MDEYNLPLGLDIEKVIRQAQTVTTILGQLNTQAENVGRTAQQSFNQASTAATNLGRNVTQQAAAFSATTRSVENMNDALKDLKAMRDEATSTERIRYFNREIQVLEAQIRQTANIGRAGFDEMGNRIRSTTQETSNLSNGLKTVGKVLATVFSVAIIVNFAKELYALGVQASGIERAFSRLGDSASLAKLREETRGFVSDLQLEKLTVKANNFNIPIDKLGGLLAFASQRAKETGDDVDRLTNNIIDGLGRKSSRIIDNLGISIVDIQKEFKKTGDFTTAVSNLIAKEMTSAGVPVDTLADKVSKMSAFWDNAKKNVAEFFVTLLNPSVARNDIISDITSRGTKQLGDLSKASSQALAKIINDQEALVQKISTKYVEAQKSASGFFAEAADIKVARALGEQLASANNILRNLKDQNLARAEAERLAKNILSVTEMEAKVTELRSKAKNIVPGIDGTTEERSKLLKQADEIQKQIDEITGKAQKKRDKLDEQAEVKRLARIKALNAERVKLENDFYSSQIEAIDDAETKAVASETVKSQNVVRELENRKKLFPELTKQINALIEEEERQSAQRVKVIIAKGQEDELKARKASQQEIARVLKDDTDSQIEAISDRYELIRQNAKKAGTLNARNEQALIVQEQKEINDAVIKAQDDTLKKQEQLAISGILIRKKRESQSEKAFERENQEEILKINIEFAKKRLELISADPSKIKEANDLRKAIQDAQNTIEKLNNTKSVDLLDLLGISQEKLKTYTDAIASVGSVASDLFSALSEGAQQRVDEIQQQIDAIDELISAQENAVDKEKELMDKGYANDYDNAQRGLQAKKQQRDQLLKEQEETQKKQQELQRLQLIGDSIAQASNLITASTDIFKVFAKIPFIGVPLAIGVIATMFGAFALAKVNAFNATKLAEGGTAGGKLHSDGGNKYVSMDGNDPNVLEIERGEEVIKRSSSEKHRKLLKAINRDDFSGLSMNDTSIKALLEGTGAYMQIEMAKDATNRNSEMTESSKVILIGSSSSKSEEYLKGIEQRLERMEKQNSLKPLVLDFGDYYTVKIGKLTQKIWKI